VGTNSPLGPESVGEVGEAIRLVGRGKGELKDIPCPGEKAMEGRGREFDMLAKRKVGRYVSLCEHGARHGGRGMGG
jgi:hypothetical protein